MDAADQICHLYQLSSVPVESSDIILGCGFKSGSGLSESLEMVAWSSIIDEVLGCDSNVCMPSGVCSLPLDVKGTGEARCPVEARPCTYLCRSSELVDESDELMTKSLVNMLELAGIQLAVSYVLLCIMVDITKYTIYKVPLLGKPLLVIQVTR